MTCKSWTMNKVPFSTKITCCLVPTFAKYLSSATVARSGLPLSLVTLHSGDRKTIHTMHTHGAGSLAVTILCTPSPVQSDTTVRLG